MIDLKNEVHTSTINYKNSNKTFPINLLKNKKKTVFMMLFFKSHDKMFYNMHHYSFTNLPFVKKITL